MNIIGIAAFQDGRDVSHICQTMFFNVGSLTRRRQELGGSTTEPGNFKIEAGGLQNRAPSVLKSNPRPPKSEPVALQDAIFQRDSFKMAPEGARYNFLFPKWPTWLHLGGPRPSKIEAETRKNRC